MIPNIGLFSYSVSSIGYLVLAILLLISWRGRIEGGMLLVAVMVQFISSGLIAFHSVTDYFSTYNIFILEVSKVFAWVVFMLRLLGSGSDQKILPYLKNIFYLITIISLYVVIFEHDFIIKLKVEYNVHVLKLVMLTFSIFGLVLVEQIYRNIQPEKKWEIKFLCIGLAALFAYDIYLYSNISLFEGVNQTLWDARGIVNALSIPLIAISAKRNTKWSFDIFVSRHIVFYSAGVVAIGIYLILMSAAGYYLKSYGGTWGGFAQIIFLVGAILILIVVMSSGVTRAKIRVFLSKHFYKNKYDYRDEWLRLIHNISEYKSAKHFKDNIIQTVAGILRCRGGVLFLEGAGCFQSDTSWNCPDPVNKISFSSSLIRFLNKYEW
ncbi:MAG TPA: PEP-CTERM system histidine kinase PrsK, partial [Ignavibacteria bacterium]|nr:PEP-CTERM system histidine kinase PrsK [Ignavibacteria bacterium]